MIVYYDEDNFSIKLYRDCVKGELVDLIEVIPIDELLEVWQKHKADNPQTDCGGFADRLAYERGVKHAWEVAQKVFDSTVTFYEAEDVAKRIDKDINVRSKTEPSFKVDGIGDDDSTIHAIAHLQKVGWLQEHDRALTEPQTKEWHDDCNTCRWHACTIPCCDYEPKTEPITHDDYIETENDHLEARCLNCANSGSYKCSKCDGEMYFKDEPQTAECPFDDTIPCEWVCTEYGKCKYKPKDEPQNDLLVTEYPQDGEVNLIGRDKTEAVVMAYDTYKELTEPQTDCSWQKGE